MEKKHLAKLVAAFWTIMVLGFVVFEFNDEQEDINEIAIKQAVGILNTMDEIVKWNMSFGGVFVEVTRNTPSNLVFPVGGVITTDGRRLSQVSFPRMITQISSIEVGGEGIETHTSSLKPINPMNKPDPWERKSLEKLEDGAERQMEFTTDVHGHHIFRYMKPIYVEKVCLECHSEQGYKVGDVRAGITANIHMDELVEGTHEDHRELIVIALITWGLGLGV